MPVLLLELLASGEWPPSGDVPNAVAPWLEDPVDLLGDIDRMRRESRVLDRLGDDPATARLLRLARGGRSGDLVEPPWLDTDLAVLIGVGRHAGDPIGSPEQVVRLGDDVQVRIMEPDRDRRRLRPGGASTPLGLEENLRIRTNPGGPIGRLSSLFVFMSLQKGVLRL